MKQLTSIVLGSVVSFAAIGGASAEPETYGPPAPSKAFELVNGTWRRRADSCGTHQSRKPSAAPVVPGGMGPITVYLNKNGGTYSPASATNSSTNTVDSSEFTGGTFTIPAMSTTTYNWTTLRACILAHYAAYDVNFTDTQPTSGTFLEAVIGGDGTEVELEGSTVTGLLGVAAADNFCGITTRGIAFSFSEAHDGITQAQNELCATVAHEIGHLLALEHEVLETDTMSYVAFDDAGSKSFHDQDVQCGTYPDSPSSCSCGGTTTNSGARLEEYVGLADGSSPNDPPVMTITSPANGATVAPGFTVIATGNEELSKVELRIDGDLVATDTSAPYQLLAPDDLAPGEHTVKVRGYDLEDATGNRGITVTVESAETPECVTDDDCDSGEECVDDACVAEGTTPGDLGDDCEHDEDCASNLCLVSGDEQHCVEVCDPDGDDCPSGFECLPFDGDGACWPADGDSDGDGDGGGGCATTGGSGGLPLLLGVGLTALLRRRRKR